MIRFAFVANGIELEVMASSMDHARQLIAATLPQSNVDWRSLKEAEEE